MMYNNKTDGGLDVYDWVLSPEIREYLRASHIFPCGKRRASSTAAAAPWKRSALL